MLVILKLRVTLGMICLPLSLPEARGKTRLMFESPKPGPNQQWVWGKNQELLYEPN